MITNIKQAIYPLLITSAVLGLGVYSQKKLYLSILYNLTVWTSYFCTFYYTVIALNAQEWYSTLSTRINKSIGLLVSLTSIILSVYHDKRFQMIMDRLAAVNDTLKELGTPNMYGKLHKCAKGVLIGWLVCSHLINVCDVLWWFHAVKNPWYLTLPFIENHIYHVNMYVDFLFAILLWYIGTRFDEVNELIRCLLTKEEHELRCTKKTVVPNNRRYIMCIDNHKRVLWTSMHLHLELCQIARKLNRIFEIQITVEMVGYMTYLTELFKFIYKTIKENNKSLLALMSWMDLYLWMLIFVVRLFALNYICDSVSAKANETYVIIHHLTHLLRYVDIRKEIYQFTLQIIHHPLKFTGMGLFYFGSGFLRKFFIRISTFFIIIIQTPPQYI